MPDQPELELYVPASTRRGPSLGLARLWFVAGVLVVSMLLWMSLAHLGEGVARDYFDAALAVGWSWWGAWWVARWVARGFAR